MLLVGPRGVTMFIETYNKYIKVSMNNGSLGLTRVRGIQALGSKSPASQHRSPPPPHLAIGYPRVPLSCCSYGPGRMGNMASVDQSRRSQVPLLQFWAQRYRASSGIPKGMVRLVSAHDQGFPMPMASSTHVGSSRLWRGNVSWDGCLGDYHTRLPHVHGHAARGSGLCGLSRPGNHNAPCVPGTLGRITGSRT